MTKKRVFVLTHFPSPYHVELFNAVAQCDQISLAVVYLYSNFANRSWVLPEFSHEHLLLDDEPRRLGQVERWMERADLAIFNYYRHRDVQRLINQRAVSRRAWCFWGERPGFNRLGPLGAFYRRWKLSALHRSDAPVWGMGRWAVEKYREEMGGNRAYFNVPYFSDLRRFKRSNNGRGSAEGSRTFLYSGSLIHRKGVDLLAEAFSHLAAKSPEVELKIVGDGDLRATMESKLSPWEDRVRFVGFKDWTELPSFYQSSDVLCVPSRYDGWNLAVPEGLAAGLPVIGTDRVGAAIELIRHRENGWLIPADDADALYEAMDEAATLPRESLNKRSRAAETSVANYDTSAGVDRFHQAVHGTLRAYAI
jgi:glycosyltransferase involved in cell wall biosynthesis